VRLAARDRARGYDGKASAHSKSGRDAPAGIPPHHPAAARLSAKAHGSGRRGTNPGSSPHPAERRTPTRANRAVLPARSLLKPSKITIEAVCDRRTTSNRQPMWCTYAKTTLTVILLGSIRRQSEGRPRPDSATH